VPHLLGVPRKSWRPIGIPRGELKQHYSTNKQQQKKIPLINIEHKDNCAHEKAHQFGEHCKMHFVSSSPDSSDTAQAEVCANHQAQILQILHKLRSVQIIKPRFFTYSII
jgi:hypothetical protein